MQMVGTANKLPVIQRLVQIKTVADQLHFKISTLLLHGGKIVEAITWFHQHNNSYRRLVGPADVTFLHWEWMSRQFLVFAELLETSSKANISNSIITLGTADRPLTEWEFQPAYYYQARSLLNLYFSCCLGQNHASPYCPLFSAVLVEKLKARRKLTSNSNV